MEYYPNPYFNASHFQAQLTKLKQVVDEHTNPDMEMIQRHGYCVYPVIFNELTRELTEISVCLDSLRAGASYATLASKSGLPVCVVQRILKHKRPEVS